MADKIGTVDECLRNLGEKTIEFAFSDGIQHKATQQEAPEKIQLDLDINTILNEFHHIVSSVEGIRTVLPTSTSTQPPVSFLFESISPEDLFYVKDIYRPNQLLSANIDVNYPSSKDYSDFSAQTKTLLESLDSLVDKIIPRYQEAVNENSVMMAQHLSEIEDGEDYVQQLETENSLEENVKGEDMGSNTITKSKKRKGTSFETSILSTELEASVQQSAEANKTKSNGRKRNRVDQTNEKNEYPELDGQSGAFSNTSKRRVSHVHLSASDVLHALVHGEVLNLPAYFQNILSSTRKDHVKLSVVGNRSVQCELLNVVFNKYFDQEVNPVSLTSSSVSRASSMVISEFFKLYDDCIRNCSNILASSYKESADKQRRRWEHLISNSNNALEAVRKAFTLSDPSSTQLQLNAVHKIVPALCDKTPNPFSSVSCDATLWQWLLEAMGEKEDIDINNLKRLFLTELESENSADNFLDEHDRQLHDLCKALIRSVFCEQESDDIERRWNRDAFHCCVNKSIQLLDQERNPLVIDCYQSVFPPSENSNANMELESETVVGQNSSFDREERTLHRSIMIASIITHYCGNITRASSGYENWGPVLVVCKLKDIEAMEVGLNLSLKHFATEHLSNNTKGLVGQLELMTYYGSDNDRISMRSYLRNLHNTSLSSHGGSQSASSNTGGSAIGSGLYTARSHAHIILVNYETLLLDLHLFKDILFFLIVVDSGLGFLSNIKYSQATSAFMNTLHSKQRLVICDSLHRDTLVSRESDKIDRAVAMDVDQPYPNTATNCVRDSLFTRSVDLLAILAPHLFGALSSNGAFGNSSSAFGWLPWNGRPTGISISHNGEIETLPFVTAENTTDGKVPAYLLMLLASLSACCPAFPAKNIFDQTDEKEETKRAVNAQLVQRVSEIEAILQCHPSMQLSAIRICPASSASDPSAVVEVEVECRESIFESSRADYEFEDEEIDYELRNVNLSMVGRTGTQLPRLLSTGQTSSAAPQSQGVAAEESGVLDGFLAEEGSEVCEAVSTASAGQSVVRGGRTGRAGRGRGGRGARALASNASSSNLTEAGEDETAAAVNLSVASSNAGRGAGRGSARGKSATDGRGRGRNTKRAAKATKDCADGVAFDGVGISVESNTSDNKAESVAIDPSLVESPADNLLYCERPRHSASSSLEGIATLRCDELELQVDELRVKLDVAEEDEEISVKQQRETTAVEGSEKFNVDASTSTSTTAPKIYNLQEILNPGVTAASASQTKAPGKRGRPAAKSLDTAASTAQLTALTFDEEFNKCVSKKSVNHATNAINNHVVNVLHTSTLSGASEKSIYFNNREVKRAGRELHSVSREFYLVNIIFFARQRFLGVFDHEERAKDAFRIVSAERHELQLGGQHAGAGQTLPAVDGNEDQVFAESEIAVMDADECVAGHSNSAGSKVNSKFNSKLNSKFKGKFNREVKLSDGSFIHHEYYNAKTFHEKDLFADLHSLLAPTLLQDLRQRTQTQSQPNVRFFNHALSWTNAEFVNNFAGCLGYALLVHIDVKFTAAEDSDKLSFSANPRRVVYLTSLLNVLGRAAGRCGDFLRALHGLRAEDKEVLEEISCGMNYRSRPRADTASLSAAPHFHVSFDKSVAREHAIVRYNEQSGSFEAQAAGAGAVFVDGLALHAAAGRVAPLRNKSFLQIGSELFCFLLPSAAENAQALVDVRQFNAQRLKINLLNSLQASIRLRNLIAVESNELETEGKQLIEQIEEFDTKAMFFQTTVANPVNASNMTNSAMPSAISKPRSSKNTNDKTAQPTNKVSKPLNSKASSVSSNTLTSPLSSIGATITTSLLPTDNNSQAVNATNENSVELPGSRVLGSVRIEERDQEQLTAALVLSSLLSNGKTP